MLNFAEQTGSGAVIMVWSFLKIYKLLKYTYSANIYWSTHWKTELHVTERRNARDLMHLGPFDSSSSTTRSLFQFESRKTDKHLSREPTRLRSQHNARLIFKGVSWRNFWACFCNNWTYIDEVLAFCGWLLFVVGGRKSHKHLSQEPTRLRSQNNARFIFKDVSWRNFWACFCNNWIYIDEILASGAGCCLLLGVEKVTNTFLRNQRGFEAKITPVPYSKVYHDATFEPVYVTIGSILVKFWILPLKLMHTLCLIEEIVCEFWLLPLKLMHTLCLIEEIAKCLMCSYHSTVNSS